MLPATFGAVLTLGIVLRFGTLGLQSFHHDEVVTASRVLPGSIGHLLHEVRASESCPPLYYLLAHWWAGIFGFDEVGLRSLSALFGALTIPVAYMVAVELYDRRAGLITAAIVAVNPMFVWYSQEARAYALLVLLTAVSLLFFLRALRTGRSVDIVLWGVASALALCTHYFAAGVVAIEAVWMLIAFGVDFVVFAALAIVALTSLALAPLALEQMNPAHIGWIGSTSLPRRLTQAGAAFFLGETGRIIAQKPHDDLALPFAALAVAGIALGLTVKRGAIAIGKALAIGLGSVALATAAALAGHDYIFSRNLLPALLPLCAAVGAGLAASSRRGLAATIAIALFSALLVFDIHVVDSPDLQRPDWRQVAQQLGPAEGGRALVLWRLGAIPLRYYLHGGDWIHDGEARVSEVDVIGTPGNRHPSVLPGFRAAGRVRVGEFAATRFVAPRPRVIPYTSLTRLRTGFLRNTVILQGTPGSTRPEPAIALPLLQPGLDRSRIAGPTGALAPAGRAPAARGTNRGTPQCSTPDFRGSRLLRRAEGRCSRHSGGRRSGSPRGARDTP